MNRTISLGFLAALALLALPSRAHASYTCPSYTETFEAYPSEGDTNHLIGVRCILFFQSPDPRDFAWYGEGDWGNFKYRHIGTTLGGQEDPFQFNPPYINARAADLSGNGESGNSFTAALHISTSLRSDQDRQGRIPAVIRVTSPWHEVWFHVDRTTENYTSTLAPLQNCGPHASQYLEHPSGTTYCSFDLWEIGRGGPAHGVWFGSTGILGASVGRYYKFGSSPWLLESHVGDSDMIQFFLDPKVLGPSQWWEFVR